MTISRSIPIIDPSLSLTDLQREALEALVERLADDNTLARIWFGGNDAEDELARWLKYRVNGIRVNERYLEIAQEVVALIAKANEANYTIKASPIGYVVVLPITL